MPHSFTWLVWEFVNNKSARDRYLAVPYVDHPPVPKPFKRPTKAQDAALRSDSASEINKMIRADWSKSLVAAPLVRRLPRPNWPSHP